MMELKRIKDSDIFMKLGEALLDLEKDLEQQHDLLMKEYLKKTEDLKTKVQPLSESKSKKRGRPKKAIPLESVSEEENKEEHDRKTKKLRNNATKTTEVAKVTIKSKRTRGANKRKSSHSPSHEEPLSKSARKEEVISTVTDDRAKSIKECTVVLTRLDSAEVSVQHKTDAPAQSNSSKIDNGIVKVESISSSSKVVGEENKGNSSNSEAKLKENIKSPMQMEKNKAARNGGTPKNVSVIEKIALTSEREESPLKGKRLSASRKSNSKTQNQIESSPFFKKPLPVGKTVSPEFVEKKDESASSNTIKESSVDQSNSNTADETETVASKKKKKRSRRKKGKSSRTPEEDSDRVLPVNEVKENVSPETNIDEKLPLSPSSPAEVKPVVTQRVTRSKRRKETSNVPTRDIEIASASSASDNEKQANDPSEFAVRNLPNEISSNVQVDEKPVTSARVTRSKRRNETSSAPTKNEVPPNTASSGSEEENPKPKKGSALMRAQLFKQVAEKFTPAGANVEKENHFNRLIKTGEKIGSKTAATPLKNHNTFIPTSKIKTPVYNSAKLKIASIEEAERRRKEEEALKKKMKEEEAIRNRNERLKAKQEDIRRRNEEKMQKAAAFREAVNKETEERLAKKEEEKRKEEEQRLKNLKEMEKLKKQRLEEQRLKEAQEKKAKEMMKAKANIIPLKDKDNYDIADISPDDDDCDNEDNNHPKKEIPLWAKKGEDRTKHEKMQSYVPMEVVADFFACPSQTPDLTQFFGKMTMKRVRTSSAVWLETPPLKKH